MLIFLDLVRFWRLYIAVDLRFCFFVFIFLLRSFVKVWFFGCCYKFSVLLYFQINFIFPLYVYFIYNCYLLIQLRILGFSFSRLANIYKICNNNNNNSFFFIIIISHRPTPSLFGLYLCCIINFFKIISQCLTVFLFTA